MFKLLFQDKKSRTTYFIVMVILVITALSFVFYQRQKAIDKKVSAYTETLSEYEERFHYYYYADHKDTYNTLIGNYKTGLDSKDLSLLQSCCLELDNLEHTIIEENMVLFEKKMKKLKNADLSNAYDNERKQIAQIQSDIQTNLDNHHFTKITPLLEEWNTILANMAFVADNLSISVNQADTSYYPLINLYLSIHDIENDEVPSYLVKNYFYLTETLSFDTPPEKHTSTKESHLNTDASDNDTTFSDNEVLAMEQLDGNLPLSITIAADMSNYRTEEETNEITTALTNFLDIVQFDVEDQIKIISFADTTSVCQEFSSDKKEILNTLSNLKPINSSSHFYDGLIEAITHSSTSSNAKCVIAFTDREDNGSTHTWEEVVAYANECGVPLFIIGIGKEVSPYVLERLGSKTNGFYRNVNDFSSLETVLKTVYFDMKNLYKVVYKSELEENPTDRRQLHIAYQNRLFGGSCNYIYTPFLKINRQMEMNKKR